MSLLMDALRRAEREKKERADKPEADQASATGSNDTTVVAEEDLAATIANEPHPKLAETTPAFTGTEDITQQIAAEALDLASEPGDYTAEQLAGEAPLAAELDTDDPFSQTENLTLDDEQLGLVDDDAIVDSDVDADDVEATLRAEIAALSGDDEARQSLDDSRSFTLPDGLQLEPIEAAPVAASDNDNDPDFNPEDTVDLGARSGNTIEDAVVVGDSTGGTTIGAQARHDHTRTMPSTRAVANDLNDYFDQSQSMEMPRRPSAGDQTLDDVEAHTLVNAQTVFKAGEKARPRRLFAAIAIMAVGIVLAIGVVGLYYAQRSPGPRYVPPPTVADGVEQTVRRELPIVPIQAETSVADTAPMRIETRIGNEPIVTATEDTPAPAAALMAGSDETEADLREPLAATSNTSPAMSTSQAELSGDSSTHSSVADVVNTQAAVTLPAAQAPSEAPPAARATTARLAPASAPAITEEVAPSRASPLMDVGVGQLTISRERQPAKIDNRISTAYSAFTSGDMATARSAYQAALDSDPSQRDAHLGLGAIAVQAGELDRAYAHYASVLEHHPDDVVAKSALFNLLGGEASTAASLKLLSDKYPQAAYPHFALGNWYSRQGRWADAQQAYFEAMRRDDSNADYAFNLAVSLDHIGQVEAARDYYQKSLSLVDIKAGNFNPATAMARINALSAAP